MPRLRVSRRQGRRRLEMPELWQGRRGVRRLVMSRRNYRRARHAMHVCGNTKAIVADLVTTGADALELDYKTDVRLAHDLMKDSTVFIGNLDPSSVVALGPPLLVEVKSRELIALFGDTRRFILNAGCAVPATAPEANIRAMMRAARSW